MVVARKGTPAEVVAALSGRPLVGSWQGFFPILTIDASGYPNVCLLSCAELEADGDRIRAVLASPNTVANLGRDGRAVLVVIGEHAAIYCKLSVVATVEEDGAVGVIFEVTSWKRDSIGVRLRPPQFYVDQALEVKEQWHRSARLLQHLCQIA